MASPASSPTHADAKSPLERSVRDLFKPPLEREYRDLITPAPPADMTCAAHADTTAAAAAPLPLPQPAYASASEGTSAAVPLHALQPLPAPPPYRDDGSVAFPEKTGPGGTEGTGAETDADAADDDVQRTDAPCAAIGHDLALSACQRRARVATFILCPEVAAWLMLRKRTCRRCGDRVRPKDTIFHR